MDMLQEEKKQVEGLKEEIESLKKEEPIKTRTWAKGIFNYHDQPGEVLSFIYNGQRLALKDQEKAEIPMEIADHLNSLKYDVLEWARVGKDDSLHKQGVKQVKETRKRTSFTVFDTFEVPAHIKAGMKPNERYHG